LAHCICRGKSAGAKAFSTRAFAKKSTEIVSAALASEDSQFSEIFLAKMPAGQNASLGQVKGWLKYKINLEVAQ
jgi:hypothetical protein